MARLDTGKRSDPFLKLPPELAYHIAALLPIKALFVATLVCRLWRALFLGFPELWTRIGIAFGCSGRNDRRRAQRPDIWQPLLDAYLKRSQSLPLSIHISLCGAFCDPGRADATRVSALLTANMHRVKTLSVTLSVPDLFNGARSAIPTFLQTRAPMLKSVSLGARSFLGGMTIESLFANDAPLLDDVNLLGKIFLREDLSRVFHSVTKLCYKGRVSELANILVQLPSLQRLTLVTYDTLESLYSLPPSHKVRDIQISVDKEWDASRLFPGARTICYAGNDSTADRANLSVTLKRMAHRAVKSLDMRLSQRCVQPEAIPDFNVFQTIVVRTNGVRMTVKADGVVIAVDVDWIRLTRLIVSMLSLGALETLVLHEGIWEDLMDLDLPRLKELTIQMRRAREWWPLKIPRVRLQPWAIAVLRLSHSPGIEEPASREDGELAGASLNLKAADVAMLIIRNFEPSALEKIVLRGWEVAEPGVAYLHSFAPIRYEDEVACDDWVRPTGWPTRYRDSDGLQV